MIGDLEIISWLNWQVHQSFLFHYELSQVSWVCSIRIDHLCSVIYWRTTKVNLDRIILIGFIFFRWSYVKAVVFLNPRGNLGFIVFWFGYLIGWSIWVRIKVRGFRFLWCDCPWGSGFRDTWECQDFKFFWFGWSLNLISRLLQANQFIWFGWWSCWRNLEWKLFLVCWYFWLGRFGRYWYLVWLGF